MPETTGLDSAALRKMAGGYRLSQAIYVAARLGIADFLKDGPLDHDALAGAAEAHAPSLRRVMRLLAAEGIFAEDARGKFALNAASEALLSDGPNSARNFILGWTSLSGMYRAFGELLGAVKGGEIAFNRAYGKPFYEVLGSDPGLARDYNTAMNSTTAGFNSILDTYDFTRFDSLVDVGGGQGAFLTALLKRSARVRAVLFDTPAVIEAARPAIGFAGIGERITFVAGDAFVAVPSGHDAYVLTTVLHVFDDDRVLAILRNCRRAMPPHGKVLIVDPVVPPGPATGMLPYVDVMMMVLTGGKDRTLDEFDTLLTAAGLERTGLFPVPESPFCVIEAEAAAERSAESGITT